MSLKKVNYIPAESFDEKVIDTKENEVYLVEQGFMPSGRFVNISFASGGEYAAPADGIFSARLAFSVNNTTCTIRNKRNEYEDGDNAYIAGTLTYMSCPVKKGDVVYTYVSQGGLTGSSNYFRFYWY